MNHRQYTQNGEIQNKGPENSHLTFQNGLCTITGFIHPRSSSMDNNQVAFQHGKIQCQKFAASDDQRILVLSNIRSRKHRSIASLVIYVVYMQHTTDTTISLLCSRAAYRKRTGWNGIKMAYSVPRQPAQPNVRPEGCIALIISGLF